MQIKNKIILIFICLFVCSSNIQAKELNISANEIKIDKKNNILIGKGSVIVTDVEGKIITADKATYEKSKEFLLVEGSVKVVDIQGNAIIADRAIYDKIKNIIIATGNSELTLKEGYNLKSNKILYYTIKKIISANKNNIVCPLRVESVFKGIPKSLKYWLLSVATL